MTGGSVTRYVQTGTGQIALLYFDEQTQTWSVDLFRQVETSGAGLVACDSETCRWQIEHGTRRPSAHPIELLHRAYRL